MNPKSERLGQTSYPIKRILRKFLCLTAQSRWLSSGIRIKLLRTAGIKIGPRSFIGADVTVDGIRPDLIEIGTHVGITTGVKILTHFFRPEDNAMFLGKVTICDEVWIGMNSLIVNSVEIGYGAMIAAGSVVTKDIPAGEVWGGVPAKFLRKREGKYKYNANNQANGGSEISVEL